MTERRRIVRVAGRMGGRRAAAAKEQPEVARRQTEQERKEERARAAAARAMVAISERLGKPIPQELRDLAAKAE